MDRTSRAAGDAVVGRRTRPRRRVAGSGALLVLLLPLAGPPPASIAPAPESADLLGGETHGACASAVPSGAARGETDADHRSVPAPVPAPVPEGLRGDGPDAEGASDGTGPQHAGRRRTADARTPVPGVGPATPVSEPAYLALDAAARTGLLSSARRAPPTLFP